jgi:hypothetical protein
LFFVGGGSGCVITAEILKGRVARVSVVVMQACVFVLGRGCLNRNACAKKKPRKVLVHCLKMVLLHF